MLKLLKYMKNRERRMVLGCIALIIGQIYFDLTMPDYMSDLTVLINTPGSEMADILLVGAKMLGCMYGHNINPVNMKPKQQGSLNPVTDF